MDEIRIQVDLNSLTDILQRQTREQPSEDFLIKSIKKKLRELTNQNEKIIFIFEVLMHLGGILEENISSHMEAKKV